LKHPLITIKAYIKILHIIYRVIIWSFSLNPEWE